MYARRPLRTARAPPAGRPAPEPRRATLTDVAFSPVRIIEARRLREGDGARFTIVLDGVAREAFAVRWRGGVYAYVNTCRHESLPLDFGDAHFFDEACDALVCCHHGARYRPDDGSCLAGPCAGGRLTALRVEERDGVLWCVGRVSVAPA